LSAISGRRRDKKGILKINNTVVTDEDVRNVSGYLHQEDIFTQYLTPCEHLEFMVIEQAISKVGGGPIPFGNRRIAIDFVVSGGASITEQEQRKALDH
jgi:hypothetical protein